MRATATATTNQGADTQRRRRIRPASLLGALAVTAVAIPVAPLATTSLAATSYTSFGWEDGTLQGWSVDWGTVRLSNTTAVASSGSRALGIGLSGSGYPAVRAPGGTAGLGAGSVVTSRVYAPTGTKASVQPYVTDSAWNEKFLPKVGLAAGWNTIKWTVPTVSGMRFMGMELIAPGWTGTLALDSVSWTPATTTTTPATPTTSPTPTASPTPTTSPTPTASPTPTTSPTSTPGLAVRVAGNRLVDAGGNSVQLRGVNRSGTQYACAEGWGIFDGPSDDASLAAMRSWHINAVRVNGNEDCWLGINGVPAAYAGANYQKALVDYVNRINAHGMYAIVDLHHSAPGATLAAGQQPMADRDHSPAYWTSVASTFKNNPGVLFDLYNEPYPDSNHDTTAAWSCLRDGGTCPGVSFTAAGMQELVNAVRGAGASNVIMVGGPQYAGSLSQWTAYKPIDPAGQLAASVHIYYDNASSPEWSPCYLQSCWDRVMTPLAQTTPIVIGEFGEHDCASALVEGTALNPQQQSLLTWSDSHGISYLGWSWFAGNCAAEPALISAYDGTPTGFGEGVRQHYLLFP